jgi:hypothetical protein
VESDAEYVLLEYLEMLPYYVILPFLKVYLSLQDPAISYFHPLALVERSSKMKSRERLAVVMSIAGILAGDEAALSRTVLINDTASGSFPKK